MVWVIYNSLIDANFWQMSLSKIPNLVVIEIYISGFWFLQKFVSPEKDRILRYKSRIHDRAVIVGIFFFRSVFDFDYFCRL